MDPSMMNGMFDGMGGPGWNPFSGFMSLGIGMALYAAASPLLGSAGRRKGRGESWITPAVFGGALLMASASAALSAWGTFFGMMSVFFAIFFVVGGVSGFLRSEQREKRRREDLEFVREVSQASRPGTGPAAEPLGAGRQGWSPVQEGSSTPAPEPSRPTLLNGEPLAGPGAGHETGTRPSWYSTGEDRAEGDRPSS